jgi:hypothetical protein
MTRRLALVLLLLLVPRAGLPCEDKPVDARVVGVGPDGSFVVLQGSKILLNTPNGETPATFDGGCAECVADWDHGEERWKRLVSDRPTVAVLLERLQTELKLSPMPATAEAATVKDGQVTVRGHAVYLVDALAARTHAARLFTHPKAQVAFLELKVDATERCAAETHLEWFPRTRLGLGQPAAEVYACVSAGGEAGDAPCKTAPRGTAGFDAALALGEATVMRTKLFEAIAWWAADLDAPDEPDKVGALVRSANPQRRGFGYAVLGRLLLKRLHKKDKPGVVALAALCDPGLLVEVYDYNGPYIYAQACMADAIDEARPVEALLARLKAKSRSIRRDAAVKLRWRTAEGSPEHDAAMKTLNEPDPMDEPGNQQF